MSETREKQPKTVPKPKKEPEVVVPMCRLQITQRDIAELMGLRRQIQDLCDERDRRATRLIGLLEDDRAYIKPGPLSLAVGTVTVGCRQVTTLFADGKPIDEIRPLDRNSRVVVEQ